MALCTGRQIILHLAEAFIDDDLIAPAPVLNRELPLTVENAGDLVIVRNARLGETAREANQGLEWPVDNSPKGTACERHEGDSNGSCLDGANYMRLRSRLYLHLKSRNPGTAKTRVACAGGAKNVCEDLAAEGLIYSLAMPNCDPGDYPVESKFFRSAEHRMIDRPSW